MASKKELRPAIKGIYSVENKSIVEQFQNETLRPVLKLQNKLIVELFLQKTKQKKMQFQSLTEEKKILWVDSMFGKDVEFKNQLLGLVIGMLENDELQRYFSLGSEVNKRIIQMSKQRVKDNLF